MTGQLIEDENILADCVIKRLQGITLTTERDRHYCVDCRTYYALIKGKIMCNGEVIELCPWCRPDSAPGKNGRGL